MSKIAVVAAVLLAALPCGAAPARAQQGHALHPAATDGDDEAEGGEAPDGEDRAPQGTGHGRNKGGEEGVLGDVGGLRPFFARYGVTFDSSETAETLGNPTGGRRQGAIVEGLFAFALDVDLAKAIGLESTRVEVSAFAIQGGPGLSAANIGNFNIVSDLENKRDSGLYEAWIQHGFGPAFDVRAGRMSVDEEFLIADSADTFMNGSFGWPTLPYKDLPNGGPIPADAAVRIHAKLGTEVDALAGVYAGSQADTRGAGGAASTSAVSQDRGFLAIAELQYATGKGEGALPATYKLGGWYRDGGVAPAAAGRAGADLFESLPDIVRGNYSFYAVADRRLTRGSDGDDSGFSAFLRVMAAPVGRSVVSAFADGGLVYSGPFGRPDDAAGVGFAVAQTTPAGLDALGRTRARLGRAETSFELTYQAQLAKGVQLQPDIQYVIDPGGGSVSRAGRVAGDALVLGLRSTITF